jgi:branched-chain amino acid transport system ATP-binding protein
LAFLELDQVSVHYSGSVAVQRMSLSLERGASLSILGPNGAGKSSLLRALSRLVDSGGTIRFDGKELPRDPTAVVRVGLIQCPERRRLFPYMSVADNLGLGAFLRKDSPRIREDLEWVLSVMPRLGERLRQRAGTLSGGEQQMLAIGRSVMSNPKLLLLDEPSQGLAQIIKDTLTEVIHHIRQRGVSVVIAEQDAGFAASLSSDVLVMEGGEEVFGGSWDQLAGNPTLRQSYFGLV